MPAPAVAVSGGRRHHLVALWPVPWRDGLAEYLHRLGPDAPGRAFGVRAASAPLGMREVRFEAVPHDPFFNVNTPEDVALARAVAGA